MGAIIDKKLVSNRFGKKSEVYDEVTPIQHRMGYKLLNIAKKRIRRTPRKILEIGSGTGRLTADLKKLFENSEIAAIDISAEMVQHAANKVNDVRFITADAEQFYNELESTYDLIISNATVQWFNDPSKTLRAYRNLLSPNGKLLFSTFGGKTFVELKSAFDFAYQNLGYAKNEHVTTLPPVNFWKLAFQDATIKEQVYQPTFLSVRNFLKSVQEAGATYSVKNRSPIPKEIYKEMIEYYKNHYSINGMGEVQASYHAVFILIENFAEK